jgi:hypothetical protein
MASNPSQQQLSLSHGVPGTVYVLHFDPAYKQARLLKGGGGEREPSGASSTLDVKPHDCRG